MKWYQKQFLSDSRLSPIQVVLQVVGCVFPRRGVLSANNGQQYGVIAGGMALSWELGAAILVDNWLYRFGRKILLSGGTITRESKFFSVVII